MQRDYFSKHRFLVVCLVFCGAMLTSSHDARALSLRIGDSSELGSLWPGIQHKTDNQNKIIYVNHLIGMARGAIDVSHGEIYSRSNNGFKSLPTATQAINGGGRAVRLGTSGLYTYLFATYNGVGTEIWYVGNLHGIVMLPLLVARHHLSGWTLLGPSGVGVPDGGLTVALLGVALAVLALTRRFLMR
jgi:hypothetical protein